MLAHIGKYSFRHRQQNSRDEWLQRTPRALDQKHLSFQPNHLRCASIGPLSVIEISLISVFIILIEC